MPTEKKTVSQKPKSVLEPGSKSKSKTNRSSNPVIPELEAAISEITAAVDKFHEWIQSFKVGVFRSI